MLWTFFLYTMSILRFVYILCLFLHDVYFKFVYMLWTFFLYTMSILRFVYMLRTLFPTRYLFWRLFTCCELCYTMSILANKPVNVFGKYFFMPNKVWQCDPYMFTLFMSSLLYISCNFVFDCIWLYYNCPPFSSAIFITRFCIVLTLFIYNHGNCNYI